MIRRLRAAVVAFFGVLCACTSRSVVRVELPEDATLVAFLVTVDGAGRPLQQSPLYVREDGMEIGERPQLLIEGEGAAVLVVLSERALPPGYERLEEMVISLEERQELSALVYQASASRYAGSLPAGVILIDAASGEELDAEGTAAEKLRTNIQVSIPADVEYCTPREQRSFSPYAQLPRGNIRKITAFDSGNSLLVLNDEGLGVVFSGGNDFAHRLAATELLPAATIAAIAAGPREDEGSGAQIGRRTLAVAGARCSTCAEASIAVLRFDAAGFELPAQTATIAAEALGDVAIRLGGDGARTIYAVGRRAPSSPDDDSFGVFAKWRPDQPGAPEVKPLQKGEVAGDLDGRVLTASFPPVSVLWNNALFSGEELLRLETLNAARAPHPLRAMSGAGNEFFLGGDRGTVVRAQGVPELVPLRVSPRYRACAGDRDPEPDGFYTFDADIRELQNIPGSLFVLFETATCTGILRVHTESLCTTIIGETLPSKDGRYYRGISLRGGNRLIAAFEDGELVVAGTL